MQESGKGEGLGGRPFDPRPLFQLLEPRVHMRLFQMPVYCLETSAFPKTTTYLTSV